MSGDRWQRLQVIFEEALERPLEERPSFVTEVCRGDVELQREVKQLLAHDRNAPPEFLHPPDRDLVAERIGEPSGADVMIGLTIGNYHIKGIIGSGGMGTVYLAEQAHPRRDVALKILRGGVSSRFAQKRFEYESHILAHLRHPNIAQVYEAGTYQPDLSQDHNGVGSATAVPYFAMEYIPDADAITAYADQVSLSTRERLRLFLQVCDAVHHGHQKGVIHRDLKPANILVSCEESTPQTEAINRTPEVKIIDFGVARATDSDIALTTMETDVGQLIGTLQYMSPEQCNADPNEIDTRSDVYSLGVVLYELLTLQLPYDVSHMTIHSGARLICERIPAKPSVFDRQLRGDVETIVLKALEKECAKRYQSAAELAGDIRRYLKGEPIDARPPTAWIKACRWITRHPVFATCIACASLGVIIIAGPLIVFWHLNTRPYSIVRLRDGMIVRANDVEPIDEVNLHTRSGNVLHTWGGKASSIVTAKMVARPSQMGGGKVAIIGYNDNTIDSIRNTLSAYDLNGDLEIPIWSHRINTEDILFQLRRDRNYVGEQFCIRSNIIADVFPGSNHPGDEIVAIFGPETSQRIIRIYDLNGKLLYQVWHEGDLYPPYWMSDVRLMIFAGENALINWDRNGNPRNSDRNPFIVFALRPEPGHIGDSDYLQPEASDDPLSPVWYNCLRLNKAPASRDHIQWVTTVLPTGQNLGRIARINILVDDKHSVCWTIDEFGNEVPNTRIPSDTYKRNQLLPAGDPDKLPNPEDFDLGPIPKYSTSQPVGFNNQ